MKVIYIDVLLAVNLLVDYALLCAASSLAHAGARPRRLLAGAALSALCSLVILLPKLKLLPLLALRLCLAGLTSAAAFGIGNLRRFVKNTAALLFVTFIFGGAVYGFAQLTQAEVGVNNLSFYFNGAPLTLLLCVTGIYLALKLALYVWRGRVPEAASARLMLSMQGCALELTALADTGNTLRDALGDNPVIIVAAERLAGVLSAAQLEFARSGGSAAPAGDFRFRLIPYRALAGEGTLVAFFADSCEVTLGGRRINLDRPLVAVSHADSGAQAIIGSEIIKMCGV